MLLNISNYYILYLRPKVKALITQIVYKGSRVTLGKGIKTDSIPRIIVDKDARLYIGNNVEFRRNVEIRVHGNAKVYVGDNVRIDRGVRILAANNAIIQIGDKTRIGLYTVLNGGDSIEIGKKVLISGFVYLQTSMHGYQKKDVSVQEQGYNHSPIFIRDDAWLGTHVVVLPGVELGKGSVVGSNAVVTKNVADYEVVAGIPAKLLKNRD